ncbi:Uncharacterized membrane protein YfhO [Lachnospiraceae bacterium]|nr:Uncharacterized membrane protein YfhO [Lachnospiraceae bacterium]
MGKHNKKTNSRSAFSFDIKALSENVITYTREHPVKTFYIAAFLLPFLATLLLFILRGIYPFGGVTFLKKDFYQQYTPFFYEFVRKLRSGDSLFYSWDAGIGANFLAIYVYYLASPFNFLSVLLPESLILEFMSYMVVLKIGFSGLTMAHYLRKHFGRTDYAMLIFSFAYAFSGFLAAYNWNVMWMDVIFLAPLVILGLEEIHDGKSPALYAITIALSIYSNYYLSIMLCIYLVLYELVLIVTRGFNFKNLMKFGWYSALGGAFSAVLVFPEVVALKFTSFTNVKFPKKPEIYMNPLELYGRHLAGVQTETGLDHFPNIYCGMIAIFLVLIWVMTRKVALKEKIAKSILAAFILLSFNLNMLNYIWHGLNYPDSLPARQAYLYIILVLTIAYEGFTHIRDCGDKPFYISLGLGAAATAVTLLFNHDDAIDQGSIAFTIAFGLATMIFMFFYRTAGKKDPEKAKSDIQFFKIAIIAMVIVELIANTFYTNNRTIKRKDYFDTLADYRILNETMQQRNADFNEPLARADETNRKIRNHSMMVDFSSLSLFSSTNSGLVTKFMGRYGIMNSRVFYLSDGTTPFTAALMGQHYTYVPSNGVLSSSDTTKELQVSNGAILYENLYTVPNGYTVNTAERDLFIPASDSEKIIDGKLKVHNSEMDPVKMQNALARELGTDEAIFVPYAGSSQNKNTLTVTFTEDQHLFAYNPAKTKSDLKLMYSDGTPDQTYSAKKYKYIYDLGFHAAGTTVTMEYSDEEKPSEAIELNLYSLNTTALADFTERLNNSEKLVNIEKKDDSLTGNIHMETDGDLVLTVPYETGWTLYVDGKKSDINLFDGLWISTPLTAGQHTIEIRFYPVGLTEGLLVTLLAAVLIAVSLLIDRRIRKKA